jgi:chaperonin cofactor prefoldin
MEQELRDKLDKLELRLEKIELQQQMLLEKLSKHIDFIDETYEGLKNPIQAATRFLRR